MIGLIGLLGGRPIVNQDAAGSRKKGRLSSRRAKPNYSPQM